MQPIPVTSVVKPIIGEHDVLDKTVSTYDLLVFYSDLSSW